MTITTFALPMLAASMQAATPAAVPPMAQTQPTATAAPSVTPPPVGQTAPETTPATTGATAPATTGATPPASAPATSGGGLIVTANPGGRRADPLEDVNVQAFDAVQSVDKAVTGPVAMGYKKALPGPIRYGVRNFFSNLQEPIVFLNYLLQFKPGKAVETAGRFGINSTLGFLGLFDTAKKKPFHLPRRRNGFGYTLGYYGVKPGPFLYLPLIGPTTVRDLAGRMVDLSVLPTVVGAPFNDPLYAIPTTTVRLLDERAESDEEIQTVRDGDVDPYTAVKQNYLRTRQAEIDALHGRHKDAAPAATGGADTPRP